MAKQYFTASEIAGLPGLPETESGAIRLAKREGWEAQKRIGQGGGWEYHISHLPRAAREALAAKEASKLYQDGLADGEAFAAAAETQQRKLQRAAQEGLKALAGLTGKKRQQAETKLQILTLLDAHVMALGESFEQGLQSFLRLYMNRQLAVGEGLYETKPKISRATIYRWINTLAEEGAARLADARGGRQKTLIDSQKMISDYLIGLIVAYPHTSPSNLHKALKAKFANDKTLDMPSLRSTQKWIKAWKEDNASVYKRITNPDAWKNEDMAAFGSAREGVVALNQLWEFDSTPADVMFTDGRHSIMGVIDVYSLRLKFIVRPTSSSMGVAAIVRAALLDWGVPQGVKTDNGSDYKSQYIQAVFKALGIDQSFCQPFCGWEKPHIERAFRTFLHDAVELLPGFIGHNVAERKAIESSKTFAERLFKKNEVVESKLSSREFADFANRWVNSTYHNRTHSTLGKTPNEMVREWKHPLRMIEEHRALDVLLAQAPGNGRRVVGKKGIKLEGGLFIAPELGALIGEPVQVRYDDADMGRIFVYDTLGKFVCIAEDPEVLGVDRQMVAVKAKQVQKQAIEDNQALFQRLKRKVKQRDVALDMVAQAEADQAASNVTDLPKRTETYSSAGLEAAAEAVAALEKQRDGLVETAPLEMDQNEFAARRQAIIDSQVEKAAAAGPKTPVFDTEYERAWWLTTESMKRTLAGEEISFLEKYRRESPSGAKGLDALAATLPGGNQPMTLAASK